MFRVVCLVLLSVLAATACSIAHATVAERSFNIPRQSLPSALRAFGLQSGMPIVFSTSNTSLVMSPAVVGVFKPEVALARLLNGTSLTYVRAGAGFTVVRIEEPKRPSATAHVIPAPAPPRVVSADPPAAAVPVAPATVEQVGEVIVTGSSIRGVAPVGSALIGVGRATIVATAPANTKELLSAIPQLGNFGANAEQSTPNRFRTAGFQPNIHNLGIYATLTLFNGHRMAPVGGEAVFPDPSIIPVIAIDRVELIADGASSVYGSDAVAGVVNFIYRKNVEGVEASATYGWNDTRYRKRDAAVIAGHTWESGSVMAAYEFSDNLSPYNTDIDFLALGGDQRSRGGRDLRGSNCLDPNVIANGDVYAYPSWTAGRNVCGVLNAQNIITDGARHALLITGRQSLGRTLEVWSEINYSNYETERTAGRQALNLTVPSSNPYFRLPPGVSASRLYVSRSGLGLFSGARSIQSSEVYGLTVGANVDLGRSWKGALTIHASETQDYNKDPELDLLAAQNAANGITLTTALNPFGQTADNDPGVLKQIDDDYAQINDSSQRLRELQLKADGPVGTIPGGKIRAAVGVDVRSDQAVQLQTAGPPGPRLMTVRDDNISRSVMSGFAELNVPLFSEQNARPGIHSLVLSLSGRYDYYDKLGSVFNPKYGAVWSPVRQISLRGSYGMAFAAPNLGLVTSTFTVPRTNRVTNLTDATTGIYLGTINELNPGGGNPDLTPEEATTKSFGVDYKSESAPGLRLSATYYAVEYRNTIYSPTTEDILTNPQFAHLRIIKPTQAQIDDVLRRMPPQGPITTDFDAIIYYNAQNIGMRQIAGVDIDGAYRFDTKYGAFNLAVNANRQTRYKQQVVPGTPFDSRLGTSDAPHWKSRYTLGWQRDQVTISLFANYISSFRNTTVTPNQVVRANTTFDLSANLALEAIHQGASVQARVVNLFDKNPPFYDSANGYFAGLASPFGRQFELTLRATF
jgi:iron complex outermembrane receptor protein